MNREEKFESRTVKTVLVVINVVLILYTIFFVYDYSENDRKIKQESEISDFCETMETMKSISEGYFENEKISLREWSDYIESNHLTRSEALQYIHMVSLHNDRYANIVDMDTYEAWSSATENYERVTDTYEKFLTYSDDSKNVFLGNMKEMFDDENNMVILGKYMDSEMQTSVISFGTPVTLYNADGTSGKYLLLRLVPVSTMMKMWEFPVSYSDAEVGLVSTSGDYVIQSRSMRSHSFLDFIYAYNSDDENARSEKLSKILWDQDRDLLTFKDSKGTECYWYYSRLSLNSSVGILGMIPVSSLQNSDDLNLPLVKVVCGIVAVLVLIDGSYAVILNARLRKTAKVAEDASRAKTQFLSSMSHDIRTPMNAVIGMATLAKGNIDDKEYVSSCLNKILLSGNLLLTLINDILDISKIESGKLVIREEEFSLSELLTSLEAIIRPQAEIKGITFTAERNNLTSDHLIGDELRLSQIYLNLLTNAVKYTKSNGKVSYRISEEYVDVDVVRVVMKVEDNGIGMNEDYQKVMYDSFTRESDSRINKIHGSGLGLYIVKKLTDQMGGKIECCSKVNEGTTFTVSLNLKVTGKVEKNQKLSVNKEIETSDLSDIHILVAEDNDLNWEIINQILTDNGIVSDRAENGEVCVRMLENSPAHTYDMVFMDIQMPVMNGLEATKVIRKSKREDLRTLPLVAMTADAFAEDVQACKDAGMNAHLTKPLNFNKVLEMIRIIRLQGGNL